MNSKRHCMHREQQKSVDVGFATLALTVADQYDSLMLSSGDGVLLDPVDYLIAHGKRFALVVLKHGVSTELQARADYVYWIDDFADEIRRSDAHHLC